MNKERRNIMKRELCIPCAVKLAGAYDVRETRHHRDKITCAECGRRRYGNEYTIGQKSEKGTDNGKE